VATGEGWFLVIVVGKNSCVGKIREKLSQKTVETTALQEKLEAIGTDIGKVGMYCALLTVHVLFFRFFIGRFINRTFDLFGGGEDTNYVPVQIHGSLNNYL
jgi:magnesium-transporting ATPase (P-type)